MFIRIFSSSIWMTKFYIYSLFGCWLSWQHYRYSIRRKLSVLATELGIVSIETIVLQSCIDTSLLELFEIKSIVNNFIERIESYSIMNK